MFLQFSQWLQNIHWIAWTMGTNAPATVVEVVHYFSFFLIVGPVTILDLRLLGWTGGEQRPSELVSQFYPLVRTGLIITTISGLIQAAGSATQYYDNQFFYYKLLVFFAAVIVTFVVGRKTLDWERLPQIPFTAKLLALLCILLWIGTILAGVEVPALSGVG